MRALPLVFAVLPLAFAATPARADSWFGIEGGVTVPLGDKDWTDQVESSPKLGINAGAIGKTVGGMAWIDWTPENTDFSAQYPNADVSAHRFRGLVGLAFQNPINSKLYVTGRIGLGADIAHASVRGSLGPISFETSDTDVGFGFELGMGLWAKVGSMLVGGEAAVPISSHSHKAQDTSEITFDYTSYDLDVLFGVRFLTDAGS